MYGFSWNLVFEYFSKISRETSNFIKIPHEQRVFSWRQVYIYIIISRSVLGMKNVPDKSCRENQSQISCSIIFFSAIILFTRKCENTIFSGTGHRWQYGAYAFQTRYLRPQTDTQIYNIYGISTATRLHESTSMLRCTTWPALSQINSSTVHRHAFVTL